MEKVDEGHRSGNLNKLMPFMAMYELGGLNARGSMPWSLAQKWRQVPTDLEEHKWQQVDAS